MAKVLVIFGSASDSGVYEPIINFLNKSNIECELKICSAHKTPEFLDKILKTDYSLIIAGAGLAAHLPGVIASKTIRLVVGIPCIGAFNGLDAFLSIAQMPPGIPVLSLGVNSYEILHLDKLAKAYTKVNIVGDIENNNVKKCIETLEKFEVKYTNEFKIMDDAANIKFQELDKFEVENSAMVINVPLKENTIAVDSLRFLEISKKGFWTGINNGINAAIIAVQLLNYDKKHDKMLLNYREEMKKKVLEANTK